MSYPVREFRSGALNRSKRIFNLAKHAGREVTLVDVDRVLKATRFFSQDEFDYFVTCCLNDYTFPTDRYICNHIASLKTFMEWGAAQHQREEDGNPNKLDLLKRLMADTSTGAVMRSLGKTAAKIDGVAKRERMMKGLAAYKAEIPASNQPLNDDAPVQDPWDGGK